MNERETVDSDGDFECFGWTFSGVIIYMLEYNIVIKYEHEDGPL